MPAHQPPSAILPPCRCTSTSRTPLAAQLTAASQDPARAAREALALESYRSRQLSEAEVRRLPGFGTRMQVHAFLADHDVPLNDTENHLHQDIAASDKLQAQRAPLPPTHDCHCRHFAGELSHRHYPNPMGLDAVEIVLRTEDLFGLTIADDETSGIRTVGDFYRVVCTNVGVTPLPAPTTSAKLPKISR